MTKLSQDCERSFYHEIYSLKSPGQALVIDQTSEHIYLRKILSDYSTEVYAYLKDHRCRNIPYVHDFWQEDASLIVIEEYIPGETLADRLQKPLSEADALHILFGLLDALEFLHHAEPPIIHRDIKPENIMLTDDGIVKLVDYDAAKLSHPGSSKDTVLMGTAGSAAPEQYGFAASDARTDIYAVGILMKSLFPETNCYRNIIKKATRIDMEKRYTNVSALRRAILRAGRFRSEAPVVEGFHLPLPGFRSGNPTLMAFSAIAYIFLLYICLRLQIPSADSTALLWGYRITSLMIFLSLLDLFSDWTPVSRSLPFIHSRHRIVRILVRLLYAPLYIILWINLLVMFANIIS